MTPACLPTAYLAPVQYYCKLFHYPHIYIDADERYAKQTWRNRCHIADANGRLALSIPVEKPSGATSLTRDIRISNHGAWRRHHWNAITSAYNSSPYFEYYADDFRPFYETQYRYLLDFNERLRTLVCRLLDVSPSVSLAACPASADDFRESIHPRHPAVDPTFHPQPYYQVFAHKHGFLPNLSIIDLLFNMGPESPLILRDSVRRVGSF
jgi:hypothetical protein